MTDALAEVARPESHDSDGAQDKPGSLWILWLLAVLLFAYPLSVGPIAKFYRKRNPPHALIVFYEPLESLYHKSHTVHEIFDWYFRLWGMP